jgi:hypothetical protein
MTKRFALLTHEGTRVNNISLCEDYETAVAFHGEGTVVEITEATGEAVFGSHWDGSVFTPGNPDDLIPVRETEEVVEEPVE